MPRLAPYPNCCKARVLCQFGAGHLHEHNFPASKRVSKEQIKEYLDYHVPALRIEGINVIFACPTNHQPEAIEALTEYGFYGAEQEDLDLSKKTYLTWKYGEDGQSHRALGKEQVEHYMVPMFYLIQHPQKVIDCT